MRKLPACIIIALAVIIGDGALIAFMIFVFAGPLGYIDLGLGQQEVLWFDAGLSLLFFIQHSGMVRNSFRRWITTYITKEYDRAFYAIASGMVLLAVTVCWQETPYAFQAPDGIFRGSLRAAYWLSLLGFVWGVLSLKSFDPCGVLPIIARFREKEPKQMSFAARGAYLWVRHPIYLFQILAIWSYPALQADRLLFNGLWTTWIVIGAFLEERNLVGEVTRSEMEENFARSREMGLVMIADNVQKNVKFVCHCCGCCCDLLQGITKFGYPNVIVTSNFIPEINIDSCTGCGKCAKSCPIDALTIVAAEGPGAKRQVLIDNAICIGCGICALKCPKKACAMAKRGNRVIHPETTFERLMLQSLEKGTLHNQIFANPQGMNEKFMRAFVGAFLKLPPVKKALLSDRLRSKFLDAMKDGVRKQGKEWLLEM